MEDRLKTILDLQDQGYSKKEISKKVGYSRTANLSSWMKRRGYIYNEIEEKYIKEGIQEIKENDKNSLESIDPRKYLFLNDEELKAKIIKMGEQYDNIQEMLEWFRTKDRQMSSDQKTEVIEVINQGIQINLPKVDSIKTSIRVNKEVWREFGRFAEDHSEFVKGDLLCQALKEFMGKHR
ncbi:hypothetical protein [Clostridium sp.]|uniref:hypothetical protein n=1 Tax=Clostridium sp. TaxID=1506 RepID=UPI003F2DCBE4